MVSSYSNAEPCAQSTSSFLKSSLKMKSPLEEQFPYWRQMTYRNPNVTPLRQKQGPRGWGPAQSHGCRWFCSGTPRGGLREEEEMELLTVKRCFHTVLLTLTSHRAPGIDLYGLVQRLPALHSLLWLNSPVTDPSCHETALVATYSCPVLCWHPPSETGPHVEEKAAPS